MRQPLILSIYPGIDLLGRAFEEERYSIVRGPDPLWGGDIRRFHVPTGVFEGVIGGPPCQYWTRLMFLNKQAGHKNGEPLDWVVNEYVRVVEEAQPLWFLMEEVVYAPMPLVPGYHDYDVVLRDNEVGGVQPRERRFTFGTRDYRMLNVVGWEKVGEGVDHTVLSDGRAVPVRIGGSGKEKRTILGGHGPVGRPGGKRLGGPLPHNNGREMPGQSAIGRADLGSMCEAQGLPRDFTDAMPFTRHGKQLVIGNGVSMALGRAVAKAVRRAFP